jgi:citronellol/citronellal dehydrogenase
VPTLSGKTVIITGASRGIGKAIGLRAAQAGANIVVIGKTVTPQAHLPGTIQSAAEEMIAAGGKALACAADIRFDNQIAQAIEQAVNTFGGIDVLVNNASAISLTGTVQTPMKRFDLMHQVNVRGTYICSQACLPYLKEADNPHILNIAPPLKMEPRWFAPYSAYSISKIGMSLCTLGMAEEFKKEGIAVNSLWPRTAIATAAIRHLGGEGLMPRCRKAEIVADAAYLILTRPSRECTGNFFIDEEILAASGVTDFTRYAVQPDMELIPDFFI